MSSTWHSFGDLSWKISLTYYAVHKWHFLVTTQKSCKHFVYKNCSRCIQLMYMKCIQNVPHISANFCIHFVHKIKRTMAAKFCIQQKFVEIWDTFWIHFVICSNPPVLNGRLPFWEVVSRPPVWSRNLPFWAKHVQIFNFLKKFQYVSQVTSSFCVLTAWLLLTVQRIHRRSMFTACFCSDSS